MSKIIIQYSTEAITSVRIRLAMGKTFTVSDGDLAVESRSDPLNFRYFFSYQLRFYPKKSANIADH